MSVTRRAALTGAFALAVSPWPAQAQSVQPLRSFTIPSASMEPTLMIGDVVLTRWTGRPGAPALQRGDVLVFRRQGIYWCKRLIGLPGDRVAIVNAAPRINGVVLAQEPRNGLGRRQNPTLLVETLGDQRYRIQQRARARSRTGEMAERTVGANAVFVMGDNRDDSFDSRQFGDVPVADLRFVVMQVLFSRDPGRMGTRLDRAVD